MLERDNHRVTLDYDTSRLVGGSAGEAYGLGPLAVATTGAGTAVTASRRGGAPVLRPRARLGRVAAVAE